MSGILHHLVQSAPDVDDLRADSVGRSTLMARVAANDPSVTQLAWHGLGLTDAEVMTLAEVLPGNTHLRMIGLGNNPLVTSASLRALAHTLGRSSVWYITTSKSQNPTQQDVTLDRYEYEALEAAICRQCVANALRPISMNDPSVTELDLCQCPLVDSDIRALAASLVDNMHVLRLHLQYGCRWKATNDSIRCLLEVLPRCAVCQIKFGVRALESVAASVVAELQQVCADRTLARIAANAPEPIAVVLNDVWHSGSFGDTEAASLSEALRVNTVVQRIESHSIAQTLFRFELSDEAGGQLAQALASSGVLFVSIGNSHREPLWRWVGALPESCRKPIADQCLQTLFRRVAANDPAVQQVPLRCVQQHREQYTGVLYHECSLRLDYT
jgi:hypothetical protein